MDEKWTGMIYFEISSQNSDLVCFLMDKDYLELDKSLRDMEGVIVSVKISSFFQ